MTDQVVSNTILLPGGSPAAGAKVSVTLVASTTGSAEGFTSTSGVAFQRSVTADSSGYWSVTLTPNSLISPAGSVYKVVEHFEGQRVTNHILVPASGTPHLLGAILSDAPASVATAALQNHLDDALDAHDATAISYAGGTGISATTVEAALDELASEKLDVTTAQGTYQPIAGKLSGLTQPFYVAHRGGKNVAPENTMEAFRNAVACGADAIEFDCVLLADGSVAVMHDSTVDRTTTSSGTTADWSGPAWPNLVVDAGSFLGGTWGNLNPPLLDDVVREFGNKVLVSPEAKVGGATCTAAIVACLQRHGVHADNALVQSFTYTDLAAATAAGYKTMALGDALTPATIAAAGIGWVGCSTAATSSYITSLTAAGLLVAVYTVDRHDDRSTFVGYGADALISDDPLYVTGTGYRRTTDPYVTQTYYHGHLASSQGDRGSFSSPDKWGFTNNATGFRGVLQGWACPVGGNAANDSWTLAFTAEFVSTGSDDSRWISVFVADDDKQFSDSAGTGINGYHCLARKNGEMYIYRVTDGAATLLHNVTGTTIPNGGTASYLLTVTPASITWARTDVATTATTNDTTYRGGYFHFGRNGIAGWFYDVTVTDT